MPESSVERLDETRAASVPDPIERDLVFQNQPHAVLYRTTKPGNIKAHMECTEPSKHRRFVPNLLQEKHRMMVRNLLQFGSKAD